MSRSFDAKQETLKHYPYYSEEAENFFLDFVNMSREDFEYENGSVKSYIYGAFSEAKDLKHRIANELRAGIHSFIIDPVYYDVMTKEERQAHYDALELICKESKRFVNMKDLLND